jgi:hypothetical protein
MEQIEAYSGGLISADKRGAIIGGLKQCINCAPLPVFVLFIYMALRSSWLFPEQSDLASIRSPLWHNAYLGWCDLLLAGSMCLSVLGRSISLTKKNLDFLLVLSLIILLSFINGSKLGSDYIIDASVSFLRFGIAFILSIQLVRRLGAHAVESFLIGLFMVLALSALFVYSLQFGKFNRIYASGMSVASFSQVAAVVSFIAIFRRYKYLLLISTPFLLLTFSRISIAAFLFLTIIFLVRSKRASFLTRVKYLVPIIGFLIIATFSLIKYGGPQFTFLVTDRLNTKQVSNLNNRSSIWENGWYLLRSGYVPVSGVGFNAAPSLFSINSFSFEEEDRDMHPVSFHSIFFEYGFGFGIFSLFIFYYLIKRVVQSFIHRSHLAFFIFSFFLISQSLDFTFYGPKEVIIWSLFLGLGEGLWRHTDKLSLEETELSQHPFARSNLSVIYR